MCMQKLRNVKSTINVLGYSGHYILQLDCLLITFLYWTGNQASETLLRLLSLPSAR